MNNYFVGGKKMREAYFLSINKKQKKAKILIVTVNCRILIADWNLENNEIKTTL